MPEANGSFALLGPTFFNTAYHVRHDAAGGGSWVGSGHADADGDGLPRELEDALGTCDTRTATGDLAVKAGLSGCSAFAGWVDQGQTCDSNDPLSGSDANTCWTPADSDHDGLSDYEEVYGLRRCYDQVPESAAGTVGDCVDLDGDRLCDHECTGSFMTELAVSGITAQVDPVIARFRPADPTIYDIFVDTAYYESLDQTSPNAFTRRLAPEQVRQLYYTMEEEPAECATCPPSTCTYCSPGQADFCRFGTCCDDPASDCPLDPRYGTRLHLFEFPAPVPWDQGAPMNAAGDAKVDLHPFDIGRTRGAVNYVWDAQRRYSGVFRIGEVDGGGGGVTVSSAFAVPHLVTASSPGGAFAAIVG